MATKVRQRKAAPKKKSAAVKPKKTQKRAKAKAKAKAKPTEAATIASRRRAVFIDVENTSNEAALMRVLDDMKLDPQHGVTQISAIGNWRTVGPQMGRSLAERGAVLVHSAPASRIRDWSDLWIAVQAGMWLGRAQAGDVIEIVSHDRAFDAVGDAAAQLGVVFRRLTYHGGTTSRTAERDIEEPPKPRGRRRRGGRGGGSRQDVALAPRLRPEPSRPVQQQQDQHAPSTSATHDEPHGASPQELLSAIAKLVSTSPTRTTTLDALTNALKAAGFQRPPGSPRLVTRIRQLKGVEILAGGRVFLRQDETETQSIETQDEAPSTETTPNATARRPRRRGRGRRSRSASNTGATTQEV